MCDLRPEEFGPVEPRTWEFARVEFRPMMGRDSQGGVEMGQNGPKFFGPKFHAPKTGNYPFNEKNRFILGPENLTP